MLITTALVLTAVKTSAEVNAWNKLKKKRFSPRGESDPVRMPDVKASKARPLPR